MSFLRHARSIGPMGQLKTILRLKPCGASRWSAPGFAAGRDCNTAPSLIVRDEYAPAIPRRVALQQSPSPFHRMRPVCYESSRRSRDFHRTANCVLTVCVSQPDKRNFALASLFVRAATNSRVPSLHRHCSASPLLRTPPPPSRRSPISRFIRCRVGQWRLAGFDDAAVSIALPKIVG